MLKEEREEHLKTISDLESEVFSLNLNLDRMVKSLKMLNNGTNTLDKVLQVERVTGDKSGLGFNEKKEANSEKPSSVSTHAKPKPKMSNQMSQHIGKHHGKKGHHGKNHGKKNLNHTRENPQPWRCHHCRRLGHIRPLCFKLYGYPKNSPPPKNDKIGRAHV